MKYLDEYRDEKICGGQTHTIMRYGIDELLPREVELVHGPGCPVCVTPLETIDKALELAAHRSRWPWHGRDRNWSQERAACRHRKRASSRYVRVVYSPLEALKIARANPNRKVVFLAIGFETTAPPNAMAVWQAHREGLQNFSVLASHVLVPPAMQVVPRQNVVHLQNE